EESRRARWPRSLVACAPRDDKVRSRRRRRSDGLRCHRQRATSCFVRCISATMRRSTMGIILKHNKRETDMDRHAMTRRALLGASAAVLATAAGLGRGQGKQPIRIGSTLALTGPLSATAQIHKIVGEIYIEQVNARGGWLGRPLEWVLKDDQSKPDLARTLYEQLVTADQVDLLIGPYATGGILSAMGVAQRYGKVLVHHTLGVPSLGQDED